MINKALLIFLGVILGVAITAGGYFAYTTILSTRIDNEKTNENAQPNSPSQTLTLDAEIKEAIKGQFSNYIDSDVLSETDEIKNKYPQSEIELTQTDRPFIWKYQSHYIYADPETNSKNISFRHPDSIDSLIKQYGETPKKDVEGIDEEISKDFSDKFFKLIPIVDTILTKYGYTKDSENIIRSPFNNTAEIGYRKDNVLCILGAYQNYVDFFCNEQILKSAQLQIDMLIDLEKYGNTYLDIRETSGKFSSIAVSEYASNGGYALIAKNINGKWKAIYEGQDLPSCKVMISNSVPKSLYGECYK